MSSRWTRVSTEFHQTGAKLTYADFEKANEIYFRLGIIYKHQRKYAASLEVI